MNPRILAHQAASHLLKGRSEVEKKENKIAVRYKVIDSAAMRDASYDKFIVPNTEDMKDSEYAKQIEENIHLKGGHVLYPRQICALAKLLQIR